MQTLRLAFAPLVFCWPRLIQQSPYEGKPKMNTQAIDLSNAIPIYQFQSGDGFRRDDKYFKHVRTTKDHQILRRADTGIEERYSHELIHAWLPQPTTEVDANQLPSE
jgi:hypothetical protein